MFSRQLTSSSPAQPALRNCALQPCFALLPQPSSRDPQVPSEGNAQGHVHATAPSWGCDLPPAREPPPAQQTGQPGRANTSWCRGLRSKGSCHAASLRLWELGKLRHGLGMGTGVKRGVLSYFINRWASTLSDSCRGSSKFDRGK